MRRGFKHLVMSNLLPHSKPSQTRRFARFSVRAMQPYRSSQILLTPEFRPAILVLGHAYVGVPLAVALAREFAVIGLDVDPGRVEALRSGLGSFHTRCEGIIG